MAKPNAGLDPGLPETFRDVIVGMVRLDNKDLTCRQLAVFLATSLEPGLHTVSDLAMRIRIPMPAITRSLNRLEEFDLIRRVADRNDRRSVRIDRTKAGGVYLAAILRQAAAYDNFSKEAAVRVGST